MVNLLGQDASVSSINIDDIKASDIRNAKVNIQNFNSNQRTSTPSLKQNQIQSQYALGICYFEGQGTEKDWDKAKKWFDQYKIPYSYI